MKLKLFFLVLILFCGIKKTYSQKITIDNHIFTFGGYGRWGIGASQNGATQADFWAPGAQSKYRLGNEANSYLELQLGYEHIFNPKQGKSFELVYMGTGGSNFGETRNFSLKDINQLYVKMNNIYRDLDIWVGRRYYYRNSIQMQDHWWLNPSSQAQAGVGIEGIRGKSRADDIKIAVFNYEDPLEKGINGFEDKSDKKAHLNSYVIEARWVDIPLSKNSHINFWSNYSLRAANEKWGYQTRHGFGIGAWHEQKDFFNGKSKNTASISFRKGPSVMRRNTYSYVPNRENMREDNLNIINYDLKKLYSFEINNNIFYEKDKKYALEGSLIYRYENQGMVPHDKEIKHALGNDVHWFSAGFRYLYYLHKHLNLALEIGSDYVDNATHSATHHPRGWLTKLTFSPQISWNYGYFSHPVVRPFVTYAFWDESMRGLVGNTPGSAPYADRTKGFSFGIQIETSW